MMQFALHLRRFVNDWVRGFTVAGLPAQVPYPLPAQTSRSAATYRHRHASAQRIERRIATQSLLMPFSFSSVRRSNVFSRFSASISATRQCLPHLTHEKPLVGHPHGHAEFGRASDSEFVAEKRSYSSPKETSGTAGFSVAFLNW